MVEIVQETVQTDRIVKMINAWVGSKYMKILLNSLIFDFILHVVIISIIIIVIKSYNSGIVT